MWAGFFMLIFPIFCFYSNCFLTNPKVLMKQSRSINFYENHFDLSRSRISFSERNLLPLVIREQKNVHRIKHETYSRHSESNYGTCVQVFSPCNWGRRKRKFVIKVVTVCVGRFFHVNLSHILFLF